MSLLKTKKSIAEAEEAYNHYLERNRDTVNPEPFSFCESLYQDETFRTLLSKLKKVRREDLLIILYRVLTFGAVLSVFQIMEAIIPIPAIQVVVSLIIIGVLLVGLAIAGPLKYSSLYRIYVYSILAQVAPIWSWNPQRPIRRRRWKQEEENVLIRIYTRVQYYSYSAKRHLRFSNPRVSGYLLNLNMKKEEKKGNTKIIKTAFIGPYIEMKRDAAPACLNGAEIRIAANETLRSALTEDTARSIYTSRKNFDFNSESLNRALDCRIERKLFNIDDYQEFVIQVITPEFEDFLLFVLERYGSFNMGIADEDIHFAVNLKKSFYQRLIHHEAFQIRPRYRDKAIDFGMPSSSPYALNNLEYHKLLQSMESLYFIYLMYKKIGVATGAEPFDQELENQMKAFMEKDLELAAQPYWEFVKQSRAEIQEEGGRDI